MPEFNWPKHRFDSKEHSFHDRRGFRKPGSVNVLTSSRLAFRIADQTRLRSTCNFVSSAIRLINRVGKRRPISLQLILEDLSTSAIVLDGFLQGEKKGGNPSPPLMEIKISVEYGSRYNDKQSTPVDCEFMVAPLCRLTAGHALWFRIRTDLWYFLFENTRMVVVG